MCLPWEGKEAGSTVWEVVPGGVSSISSSDINLCLKKKKKAKNPHGVTTLTASGAVSEGRCLLRLHPGKQFSSQDAWKWVMETWRKYRKSSEMKQFGLLLLGRDFCSKIAVIEPSILTCAFLKLWASQVAQMVRNPPAVQETWVRSLGQEDPLEKGMVTHSSILAWRIPWTEEPGELYSPLGCIELDTTEWLSHLVSKMTEIFGEPLMKEKNMS